MKPKAVIWNNGIWIIYNGKAYSVPNAQAWGLYSKMNDYLGLSNQIKVTDAEMAGIPKGDFKTLPPMDQIVSEGKNQPDVPIAQIPRSIATPLQVAPTPTGEGVPEIPVQKTSPAVDDYADRTGTPIQPLSPPTGEGIPEITVPKVTAPPLDYSTVRTGTPVQSAPTPTGEGIPEIPTTKFPTPTTSSGAMLPVTKQSGNLETMPGDTPSGSNLLPSRTQAPSFGDIPIYNVVDPTYKTRYLFYGGKLYRYPDPNSWTSYSKLNEYLGLPTDIILTPEQMTAAQQAGVMGVDLTIDPETLRQQGETAIRNVAKQGEASQETGAKTIADHPMEVSIPTLVQEAKALQDSYAPGYTGTPGTYGTSETTPTTTPTTTPMTTPETTPTTTPPVDTSPQATMEDILNTAVDSVVGIIDEVPKPYDEVNPFYFDELLAREASTAEYSPYYHELLQDYTSRVEQSKSRSREDLAKTLETLSGGKEYYLGKERELLDKAVRTTAEGYAGQNLFFSGAKEKDIKELKTESQKQTGEYGRQYEYQTGQARTSTERTVADLQKEQEEKARDLAREEQTAVEGGVAQRKQETLDEYLAGMRKYYQDYPSYYKDELTTAT